MPLNQISINEDSDHKITLEGINLNFQEIFTSATTDEIGRKILASFLGSQVFWQRYENERLMFNDLDYTPRMWYPMGIEKFDITDRYSMLSSLLQDFTYEEKLVIANSYYLENECGFVIGKNGNLMDKMYRSGLIDIIEDKKEAVYMNLLMQDISTSLMIAEKSGLSTKGSRSALAKKITNHENSLNNAIGYFNDMGIKADVFMKIKPDYSLINDEYFVYLRGISYLFAHHYIMSGYRVRDKNMVSGIDAMVWGYQISVIGDCPVCTKYSGYRKDVVEIPIHIGCTCMQITILKVVAEREGLKYSE